MNYQYTAKSAAGETLSGLLNAASLSEVHQILREKQLFVLAVTPAGQRKAGLAFRGRAPARRRVSKRDLMTLTSQLAIMSRTGIDFASALENLRQQCSHPILKQALNEIHEDVLAGKSVSKAMGSHEYLFGKSYIASIAAAEAAGKLPDVLQRLADLLRGQLRMRSTLRTLLAYPIMLASISSLVILALMFFVLPQFASVFDQLEISLPFLTQMLVDISAELRGRFLLWGGLIVVGIAGCVAFGRSAAGHRYFDRLMLNMVFVRDVTRALLVGRAFRLLGTMIASGVPLLDGLRLTRSSIHNTLFAKLFEELEHEVLNGRGMGATFLATPFVPPAAGQMIATAEQTGTFAMVADMVGQFYEEEGETKLRELATVLEPLIIIVMGAVVALVVMSVMLPVFDFATAAK